MFKPGSLTSLYCRESCQKTAQRRRRAIRDGHPIRENRQRTYTPYYAVHTQPTYDELLHTCLDFVSEPYSRLRIFVGTMPPDFKLLPGLELIRREDGQGWHISHVYKEPDLPTLAGPQIESL